MNIRFNSILIPVDFTVNTSVAIRKALSLNPGKDVIIHLLHVIRKDQPSIFSIHQYFTYNAFEQEKFEFQLARQRLDKYRSYIAAMQPGADVVCWIVSNISIEQTIIKKARAIGSDLIIIGKNSHHSWLPFLNTVVPSRIAQHSGLSVLTVKPGSMHGSVRTVVMPIGEDFPDSKVAAVNELQKRIRVQIRLVAFLSNQYDSVTIPASLLNAYRILKKNTGTEVSYEILQGNNRAKAILNYCVKVEADMLIVHPESETNIGWLNRQISDVLPVHSKTQILAINK